MTKATSPVTVTIDGTRFREHQGPNYSWDLPDLEIGDWVWGDSPTFKAYCDNTVRFYVDSEGDEHVVIYLERNGHEFWPTEHGSQIGANEHNGKGPSFLTAYDPKRPLNLGEVDYPLSDDAKLILWFNGRWGAYHTPWGSAPYGPALHQQWTWPIRSTLRKSLPSDAFE